jgi:hypothetical protein
MTKMEKPKIISISSETYPGGRVDSFTIPNISKGINHKCIIPLLRELGFPEDSLNDLDIDFENQPTGNYFFSYGNKDIKSMIIIGERKLSIIFDTNLDKNKINQIIRKYFDFP